MRVEVDQDRCVGSGMCALTDPTVFDQDETDGTVLLLEPSPTGEHAKAAREAEHLCPAGAIKVVD
ncbi:ferredoxin [Actinosynnema sp. NPDC059797]